MQEDVITRKNTRILTPTEYEKLRSCMSDKYQVYSDVLLMTGLRPVEFWRMDRSWYRPARRCLELPPGAVRKLKCIWQQRTVILSLPACDAIDTYFGCTGIEPLKENSMRDAYRRYAIKAGLSTTGICTKMFRKTWVSWLVACYPEQALQIAASMGHSLEVMRNNYLGLAFPPGEMEKMRTKYLEGWVR